jgi:hypothetical protein
MTSAEAVEFHGLPAVRWRGRDGASAIATLQGAQLVLREVVTAGEAIDRVYAAAPPATRLVDAGRILRIEQRGFTDTRRAGARCNVARGAVDHAEQPSALRT